MPLYKSLIYFLQCVSRSLIFSQSFLRRLNYSCINFLFQLTVHMRDLMREMIILKSSTYFKCKLLIFSSSIAISNTEQIVPEIIWSTGECLSFLRLNYFLCQRGIQRCIPDWLHSFRTNFPPFLFICFYLFFFFSFYLYFFLLSQAQVRRFNSC